MAGNEAGTFGVLLRRYRQAAALSQEALAERAGISPVAVSALERGARRAPHRGTVDLLAGALALGAADRAALLAAARPSGGDRAAMPAADALVPLVGRERELALLDRFLAGEDAPLEPVLLLAGEPGIGKTRLLRAAAEQAIARGWCVLVGGCQRRGGQESYAPLLGALAQHLAALGTARRRAALAGCAWLACLLPECAADLEQRPAGTFTPAQERRLIHAAVARMLANVAGPAGTLLVLDDLQWAGTDALDLIDTLARGAPPTPRLVGAYRDTEVRPADPLGLLVADLAQARLVQLHPLGPLAAEEAAALLDNLLVDLAGADRGLVERVLQRAGGMPFFLVSYAQALRQGGAEAVPWDLAQGLRQRVALLPEAAQALVGTAAVAGRRVPRALLAAATGQAEEAMLAGLEAACRARLLLEEGDDTYAFAHDLVREVVEGDLGAARRAVLHRRVAEALEAGPGEAPPELLAYHYAHGDAPDRAARYLERAGDHAWGQRAHSAAEHHYQAALDRLDSLGRVQDAARVREKLGEVLYRAGRYDAAIQVLEPAAEGCRVAGDLEGLERVTLLIGRVHGQRGTPDEGIARVRALLEVLDGSDSPPSLAAIWALLGQLLQTAGAYHEALAASERAIELARACGDDQQRVLAEWNRTCCAVALGSEGEARRLIEEVLPSMEAVGDLDVLSRAYHDLAYTYVIQGAFETGRTHIDRALATAEQLGDTGDLALTLALRGRLACLCGHWEQARRDLEQAVEMSGRLGRSWYTAYLLYFLARLCLAQGDGTDAARAAEDAIALAEQHTDPQALCWASNVMARCEILSGRPEAASARLLRLLDRAGMGEEDTTGLLSVLAWARLAQGQVYGATAAIERAIARARRSNLQIVLVEALWVRGMVMLQKRCWHEVACCVEEGLALARAMPYPFGEARLLAVDGRRHAAQGAPEPARERLEAALAIFRRLGACRDVAQTEQVLTTLPGAPLAAAVDLLPCLPARRDGGADVSSGKRLTRAERQAWVCDRLRADGPLSPRAYARALRISVDTALLDLRELVSRGLVQPEGTTRDRRYVLAGAAQRAGDSPNAS